MGLDCDFICGQLRPLQYKAVERMQQNPGDAHNVLICFLPDA
jgi:hypothetical protein